ncbi:NADP-dependent oxidoreductase [Amycolatopsis ultiminotia]|uniref:NADP-dependent oxidoreductase n=1 Tax=Amycolatopsis ultiminotia TaxID=543629 RepID=A0ABP6XPG1_9PSEU
MTAEYQAVVYTEYGGPEVLHVVDRKVTDPGPGEVRIAVRAAGLNPLDWKIRTGAMAAMRPVEFPVVPGMDVAGVVEQIGAAVTEFRPGDEVLGTTAQGSFAEYVLAETGTLAKKPAGLSWDSAAALPVVATTAYRVLNLLELKPQETLLIDGVAGGVGTIAVQLAAKRGLTVIGTCREDNHEYVRSLGATPVSYGDGLADRVRAAAPQGVDAALDASGRGSLPTLVELTGDAGRVIAIAGRPAVPGVRFSAGNDGEVPGSLAEAAELAARGELKLPVHSEPFSAEGAAELHRRSETGHTRGKLVLHFGA